MTIKKTLITLVAAMGANRCIGVDGKMPWHIPEDYKHFFRLTVGKPCIMGRKTFESVLQEIGKPLPRRPNLIISRSDYSYPGVQVFSSYEKALEAAEGPEICITGGAQIYALALPEADVLELTHIYKEYDGDTFFPEFAPKDWAEVSREDHPGDSAGIPPFSFVRYERR